MTAELLVLKSHKKEVETVHVANRIKYIPAHVASCDTFLATVHVVHVVD